MTTDCERCRAAFEMPEDSGATTCGDCLDADAVNLAALLEVFDRQGDTSDEEASPIVRAVHGNFYEPLGFQVDAIAIAFRLGERFRDVTAREIVAAVREWGEALIAEHEAWRKVQAAGHSNLPQSLADEHAHCRITEGTTRAKLESLARTLAKKGG